MPPLETDIAVEAGERVRFEYRVTQELKNLCSVIKQLMSERLRRIRELKDITEMCKPDQSQNPVTEVNAEQEKPQAGEEEE